jgi:peptide-methionine (S)-S-oxide reductase
MKLPLALIIFPASASSLLSSAGWPERTASSLTAIKEGTFGMGCFWEPAEELLKVDGVVETVAGYTGNPSAMKEPSYDSVCFSRDWVEGVRVKYDDERISYEQLLDAFFDAQKPKLGSRQYSSIIFPHDEEQKKIAKEYLQENAETVRKDGWMTSWTAVEPLSKFYQAEGYHQSYWQKQRPRFAAIVALIAVSTGVLDPVIPDQFQKLVENFANVATLAIGIYQILERAIDAKVVEL